MKQPKIQIHVFALMKTVMKAFWSFQKVFHLSVKNVVGFSVKNACFPSIKDYVDIIK